MMRKAALLGLTAVCCLMATTVFAEDVFATKNGKKYHEETCKFIQGKNAHKVELSDAEKKGLKPCGACHKEAMETKEIKKK
jgi:hypothetical protein